MPDALPFWPRSYVGIRTAVFRVFLQSAVESGVPTALPTGLFGAILCLWNPSIRLLLPALAAPPLRCAKFAIGQVVKHRIYPFRGVIFDVDPVFANTEEWLSSIPEEMRPRRDQPLLPSARRERADHLRGLRLRAEPAGRRYRQAGVASAGAAVLQGTEARPLRLARARAPLVSAALPPPGRRWRSSRRSRLARGSCRAPPSNSGK